MNRFSCFFFISFFQPVFTQFYSLPCGNASLPSLKDRVLHLEYLREACDDGEVFIVRLDAVSPQTDIEEVCFNLITEAENVRIYAEKSEISAGNITATASEIILDYFINETPGGFNFSFHDGIKAGVDHLGLPPNIDGSGIVNILLMDIRDQFSTSGNYIAGYFDPEDQGNPAFNGKDIVYIDSNPVDLSGTMSVEPLFTLTHEYQHLVHYASDPLENILSDGTPNPWLNEGISDLMPFLLGFGHRDFGAFFNNTLIGLDDWVSGDIASYGKSALFVHFLFEQLGFEFIQMLFNDSSLQRLNSVENGLNLLGISFQNIFYQWLNAISMSDFELLPCILPQTPQIDLVSCFTLNEPGTCELNINFPMYSFLQIRVSEFIHDLGYALPSEISAQEIFLGQNDPFNNDKLNLSNSVRPIFISTEFSGLFNEAMEIIKYPDGSPDNYLTLGNSNWFGVNSFNIESKSRLSSVSIKTAENTPITISIHTQEPGNIPRYEIEVCEPISRGITRIELFPDQIYLHPGELFVKVEMNKNQLSYFSDISGTGSAFYSMDGSALNDLSGLQFEGNTLEGAWGIGVELSQAEFISVEDTLEFICISPNPYYPKFHKNGITVKYYVEKQGFTKISVFDLNGGLIMEICEGFSHEFTEKSCSWNGDQLSGQKTPSGTYIVQLKQTGFQTATKLTIIR